MDIKRVNLINYLRLRHIAMWESLSQEDRDLATSQMPIDGEKALAQFIKILDIPLVDKLAAAKSTTLT